MDNVLCERIILNIDGIVLNIDSGRFPRVVQLLKVSLIDETFEEAMPTYE